MRTEYNSVADAVKKYPNLKQTVDLANKLGCTLLSHSAQFNKRGTVNSHWFRTKAGFERNQILLSWLKHMNLTTKTQTSNL